MAIEYVLFSRPLKDETVNELVGKLNEISKRGQDIYLLLNSSGGNVHAGIHCYNMLRALPTQLTTHNVGRVNSIANAIFLAGDKRFATASAIFMFHGVTFTISSQVTLGGREFREYLDSVRADHDRIAAIIADRSKLTLSLAAELFDVQTVRTTDWAVESGIIHEVKDLHLPADRVLHELV